MMTSYRMYGIMGQADRARQQLEARGWISVPWHYHQIVLDVAVEFPGTVASIALPGATEEYWIDPEALRAYRTLIHCVVNEDAKRMLDVPYLRKIAEMLGEVPISAK